MGGYPVQAVIMAGGDGTRLRPLTCELPKPMIPVANRPVMWYILDVLSAHDIDEIFLTLRCMPEWITRYVEEVSEWRQRCRSFIEPRPMGTAGGVKLLEKLIQGTFVVMSGDALTNVDLTRLVEFHKQKGAMGTLALTRVKNPLEYGVVLTSPDGRIKAFLEKPSWGEVFSDLVNTGIYVLEREVLDYIPKDAEFDFSRDLFPLLLRREIPLFGMEIDDYWCDIGNIREYVQAHMDIMTGKLGGGWFRFDESGVILSEGVEIHKSAFVKGPAIIGRNATIGRDVRIDPFTVIGSDVVIAEGASLKCSVVWDNCFVGPWSELRGTVLAQGVRVKEGARLFEGSVVGARTVIGEGSVVRPSVMVWPGKSIEPGSTLNVSVVWHSSWPNSLFGRDGIPGTINLSLTPELGSRIGAAFGSLLSPGSKVVVGTAGNKGDQMLKHCVLGGLLSTGIEVVDIGSACLPVARCATSKLADGGVYIAQRDGCGHAKIVLLDGDGVNLSKELERKFDSILAREAVRRVLPERTGGVTHLPNLEDEYLEDLIGKFDQKAIGRRGFRIAGICGPGPVSRLVRELAGRLGIRLELQIGDELSHRMGEGVWSGEMARLVSSGEADLGVVLSGDGEEISLIGPGTERMSPTRRKLLASWLLVRDSGRKEVAVPLSVASSIERLARQMGKELIRCKDTPRSLFEASRGMRSEFSLSYDGLALMLKTLEAMARGGIDFPKLIEPLGQRWLMEKVVPCRIETKGKVMRYIIERNGSCDCGSLVEGVRLVLGGDSILVVPDPLEPCCHIYIDAETQEKADRLANEYTSLIERVSLADV